MIASVLVSCPDPTHEWSGHETEPLLPPVFANTQIATWSGGEKARLAKQVIKNWRRGELWAAKNKSQQHTYLSRTTKAKRLCFLSVSSSVSSFHFQFPFHFHFLLFHMPVLSRFMSGSSLEGEACFNKAPWSFSGSTEL